MCANLSVDLFLLNHVLPDWIGWRLKCLRPRVFIVLCSVASPLGLMVLEIFPMFFFIFDISESIVASFSYFFVLFLTFVDVWTRHSHAHG